MRTNNVYRVRLTPNPVWPQRKGLRAPAVHNAPRFRAVSIGAARGDDRAAQAMAVLNKMTLH